MLESVRFEELIVSRPILRAIEELGYEAATPIQSITIPLLIAGKDVIGQAQTGTGKTAAFAIPILHGLLDRREVQAIVLTPTRELAIQVAGEINKLGKFLRVKAVPIYGGQSIEHQLRALSQGVQVVIGTPGRVMDHLRRKSLRLNKIRMVVLDEADEMLDMGFIEDIEFILGQTPDNRQTVLFSATMPPPMRELARKYMRDPDYITIPKQSLTVPKIRQVYYEVSERDKVEGLCRLLDTLSPDLGLVFCRTKRSVDQLTATLKERGYSAEGLHGDLTQPQRDRVMKKFRQREIELLVATDVAARGIDVENISHVINFDIPQDPESYVHRIGRTGRAGKEGMALTLVTPREQKLRRAIEDLIKTRIRREALPSPAETQERQRELARTYLLKAIESNELGDYRPAAAELLESYDPGELVAAALKAIVEQAFRVTSEPAFHERETASREMPAFSSRRTYNLRRGNNRAGVEDGMVRLFINIGRLDRVGPGDIVGAIAGEAGIPGGIIGRIDIHDRFTFVEVPEACANQVLEAMHENTIKGRPVSVEPAQ
ncbi:MAG: DEAD/DEAH box helicase [Syntrophothermus sp.]